ncbi:MAG TPA: NUDIX domain-containing protein [Kofleriaceae bacterium]
MPWTPPQRIRALAIAIIREGDRLLVMEGRNESLARTFYRPLVGGIELGERGEEAVRRELREEIGAELTSVAYIATIENLYELEGQRGHEIVLVYSAELVDRALYERETFTIEEANGRAIWISIADARSGGVWLVPTELVALL